MIRHWGRYSIAIGTAMPPLLRALATVAGLGRAVLGLFLPFKFKPVVNQPAGFGGCLEHVGNRARQSGSRAFADEFGELGRIGWDGAVLPA
jgi:hypothetical protein